LKAVSVETLGRFSLHVGGEEVVLRNQKSRAIIAYLALSDHVEEARERLVGLLWSESETGKARSSLRTCLHEIRGAFHAVGFDGLITDKLRIGLRPEGLGVDVREILAEARAGRAHPLLLDRDHLFEDLLPGFEELDPGFASWLAPKRRALHDRLVRDLETAMRDARIAPAHREEQAKALTRLDPTHEEAVRVLIRSRWSEGDTGAALGLYKKLWDLLASEYDVEPSAQTTQLIAELRMTQPTDDAGSEPRAHIVAPKIDVASELAEARGMGRARSSSRLLVSLGTFDAAGIAAESRYLVQEFRRELIASLVRFREWVVRDLPQGRGALASPTDDEVALEGGGYQTENGVRLILTLRETESGTYLWSERLDISARGWWDSQKAVVQRMASALNVHISASRLAAVAGRPEEDLMAHDLWLRGQAIKISFQAGDWHRAADLFRELIRQKPAFAPAYSSLAQLHNSVHVTHYGLMRDAARRVEGLRCAREAVRLDPTDSRSQLCLGWAYLMANQHDHAAVHYDLACELNDNDPWTMTSAALGFAFGSDHGHAREIADNALALSPTFSSTQWGYQARIRFLGGDYAGADEAARQAADVPALLPWKAAILCHLGETDEGHEHMARFYELSRQSWCGTGPWTREAAVAWFLTAFPIRERCDWERLRDGLARAGAPTGHVLWSHVSSIA
jgi:DNA-binding SARP family transcriptional activator